MIRILHIGNGNEKHRGKRFYDVGRKLQHGLIRCGYNSLFFSDRDVFRTSGIAGTRIGSHKRTNDRLVDVARNFRPDMLLLGHADLISNQTLERIRTLLPHVKIAQFNVDGLYRPPNHQAIRDRIGQANASFITTGGRILRNYCTDDHQAYYMPNPIDPALECARLFEHTETKHDVFYAIRRTPESSDRLRLPRHIKEQAPELRTAFFGFDGAAELFGAAFYDTLSQCAIGLNISHKQTSDPPIVDATEEELFLYSSDRLSQYIGNGLLCFTERGFAQERLFVEDQEMIFFTSAEELTEKLVYYSKHPQIRASIAKAGWEKAHHSMNATVIAAYIVAKTMQDAAFAVPAESALWEQVSLQDQIPPTPAHTAP